MLDCGNIFPLEISSAILVTYLLKRDEDHQVATCQPMGYEDLNHG